MGIMGTLQIPQDWFGLLAFNGMAQTGYIVPQEYEIYNTGPGDKINIPANNETIH